MKILYYFRDLGTMMFKWQRLHIVDEMRHHNCFIEIFNPLDYENIVQANEELIKKLRTEHFDLFMTCVNEEFLFYDSIKTIKQIGIPLLLFCPDNLVAPYNHEKIASLFDLVWLTSSETEYIFKKWKCKTVFQPYAANPYFLKPVETVYDVLRVGFIGTPHGSRINRINYLLKNNIPVTLHTNASNVDSKLINTSAKNYYKAIYSMSRYPIGRKLAKAAIINKFSNISISDPYGCLEVKDAIPLEKLSEYNGKYALILSFTDANSTGVLNNPVKIVNLRNFEIPMSGGVQCTLYSDELASYFENDKEIVMGKTQEELIDKIKYYLRPELSQKRKDIRVSARNRAEKEHTWFNRFSVVFKEMGLYL